MTLINKNTFVMLAGLLLLSLSHTARAEVTFVHTDHQGTPVAYSNGQGVVMGEESTTPFGESLNPPTGNDQPAYTGHVRDGDTGLIYMQARYYDPVVGRFLSTDPVGFESGGVDYFNRYSYVNNSPVNLVDPTGMASESNEFSCGRDPNTACYNADESEKKGCDILFDDGCAVKTVTNLGNNTSTTNDSGTLTIDTTNAPDNFEDEVNTVILMMEEAGDDAVSEVLGAGADVHVSFKKGSPGEVIMKRGPNGTSIEIMIDLRVGVKFRGGISSPALGLMHIQMTDL